MNNYLILKELTSILNDQTVLQKIANRSYLHINLFYKIIIKETNDSIWRLHYFILPGPNDLEQNPHDHGWSFTSQILFGALNETQFIESLTGSDYVKCHLNLTTTDPVFRLTPIETSPLVIALQRTLSQGQIYNLDEKTIHTTYPIMPATLTLVIQSKPKPNANNFIYIKKTDLSKHYLEKQQRCLTIDEVTHIIKFAIQQLKMNLPNSKL